MKNKCYKQFLLFSQCFPQLYIISASKCGIVLKWVNLYSLTAIFLYPYKMNDLAIILDSACPLFCRSVCVQNIGNSCRELLVLLPDCLNFLFHNVFFLFKIQFTSHLFCHLQNVLNSEKKKMYMKCLFI